MSKIKELKEWYEARERRFSSLFLLSGFIFDSLTLQRIDSLGDNLWLGINLLVVALCIILINREENIGEEKSLKHFWLFNILQFSFGALLGACFIFYFRSAALSVSWPFLLLLLGAILANEFFKKHYERLIFQLSFFYLVVFVFLIFLLPVLLHQIGALIFVLSGFTSLFVAWVFINLVKRFSREKFKKSFTQIWVSVLSIFVVINLLYFTNLIPPIPLSLKDAGIYHSVSKNDQGVYFLAREEKSFWERLHFRQKVHVLSNEPMYAYSAIFAPGALNTRVVHEWQYKDDKGKWTTASRIPLYLSGGRAEGFRTFSVKLNLDAGVWRVNVENPRGALIGRINFEVVPVTKSPELKTIRD